MPHSLSSDRRLGCPTIVITPLRRRPAALVRPFARGVRYLLTSRIAHSRDAGNCCCGGFGSERYAAGRHLAWPVRRTDERCSASRKRLGPKDGEFSPCTAAEWLLRRWRSVCARGAHQGRNRPPHSGQLRWTITALRRSPLVAAIRAATLVDSCLGFAGPVDAHWKIWARRASCGRPAASIVLGRRAGGWLKASCGILMIPAIDLMGL
jgi:hypothetical protein